MRKSLVILLAVLATLFVIALGWLGRQLTLREVASLRSEQDQVLDARLSHLSSIATDVLDTLGARLAQKLARQPHEQEALRELSFSEPYINQAFLIDSRSKLQFPTGAISESRRERELRELILPLVQGQRFARYMLEERRGEDIYPRASQHWWHSAHWRDGLHLFLLVPTSTGSILGVEVSYARVLADLLVALQANKEPPPFGGYIQLVADDGAQLASWGGQPKTVRLQRELSLAPPLQSFRILAALPQLPLGMRSTYFNVTAGVLLLGLSTALIAVFAVREYRRDLREAETRIHFVGKVSHELRTPLTSVRLYTNLLQELVDTDDVQARKYLQVIDRESERLSRLIGNVLRLGELDRGLLSVTPTATEPFSIISSVVDLYRPLLASHGMEISIEHPDSPPAATLRLIDQDALLQILHNILSNTEKYARRGRVTIVVKELGDELEMRISDQGPGVPAELLERIFEPFYRASNSLSDGVAGTGVGLGIARELARLHGGDLQAVDSPTENSGLTLLLSLHAPVVTTDDT